MKSMKTLGLIGLHGNILAGHRTSHVGWIIGSLILLLSGVVALGQATLPAFYSGPWEGVSLPTGWSASGLRSSDYPENYDGVDGNAAGLDGSGDYIRVNLGGSPSIISYYIKINGSFGEGSVFKVRESSNGSSWTDVATYDTGNPVPTTATQYEDNLLASTRYVQLIYINKDAGNVGVDGVSIEGPGLPSVSFDPSGNQSIPVSNLLALAVTLAPSNSGMSGWSLLPAYAGTASMTNSFFQFTPASSDSNTTFTLSVVATNFVGATTGTVQISVTPYVPPVPIIGFSPEAPYSIMATETQQLGLAVSPEGSGIQSWTLLPVYSGSADLVSTNFTFVPAESDGPANYTLSVIATNPFGSTTGTASIAVSTYVPPPVPGSYVCTFEDGSKWTYTSDDVTLSNKVWNLDGILISTYEDDLKIGSKSARLKYGSTTGAEAMTIQEKVLSNGIGRISLWYGPYGTNGTSAPTLAIEISESLDSGWSEVGEFDAGAVTELTYYSADVYVSWPLYMRIRAKSGVELKSANFDDITITPYPADWPPDVTFSPVSPCSIMATATQQVGVRVTPAGGGIQSWTFLPSNYTGSATLVDTHFTFIPALTDAPGTYTLSVIATNSSGSTTETAAIAVLFSHAITIAPPTNGTVATVPSGATMAGTVVSIETTPDSGYVQGAITVVDSNLNPVAITDNTFTMPESSVTVSVGFIPGYAITIAPLTNGSLATLPTVEAGEGNAVSILPTPDVGYELESVAVVDTSSNPVSVANAMFTMPASAVTISATFSLIPIPAPTNAIRFEDFNAWTDPSYESTGNHIRSGWAIQNGSILSTGGVHNTPSALMAQPNSAVLLPAFEEGAGEIQFWGKALDPSAPACLLVQTSIDGGSNWITQASFCATTGELFSVSTYVINAFSFTRICFDPAQDSGDVLIDNIDNIEFSTPSRALTFDDLSISSSYRSYTNHGWTITEAAIGTNQVYQGYSARIRNSILTSPYANEVGVISFTYLLSIYSGDSTARLTVEVSTDGVSWIVLESDIAPPSTPQLFSYFNTNSNYHYVRIRQTTAGKRMLIDQIDVTSAQPRPQVILTPGLDPVLPVVDEETALIAFTEPLYGASVGSVTGFYRIGALSPWSSVSMESVGSGFYATASIIPAQPAGTMISYYVQAQVAGCGAAPDSTGVTTNLFTSSICTNVVSTQTFSVITVQGDFIATNNPPPNMMRMENTSLWESDHHITNTGPVMVRFVSDVDAWSWGVTNGNPALLLPASGILLPGSTNFVSVTVDEPGRYQLTFNHLTGAFTFSQLYADDSQGGPPNLLKNPGFELTSIPLGGDAMDWSASQSWPKRAADGYAPHSGNWSGALLGQWYSGWSTNAYFAQDVTIGAGRTYQASAWLRAMPDWVADSMQLELEWKDAEGEAVGTDSSVVISTLSPDWVKVGIEVVAPTNASHVRFAIQCAGIGTAGSLQVDDVEMRMAGPTSYYASAYGLAGVHLRLALRDIISVAHILDTDNFHEYFLATDAHPDGRVWDMYSDNPNGIPPYIYPFDSCEQAGTYLIEGDAYVRARSWPASWCNNLDPAYSDLFHIYPADGKVSRVRSGYPFGEVTWPVTVTLNGSKSGPCSTPGYADTVFEPLDAYKGDFARTYFYMSTRYFGEDHAWDANPAVTGAELNPWLLDMLLRWHEDDPVSLKELARNEAVYALQGNRNPFIDYPEWVQDIWGDATNRALPRITIETPAALLSSVQADEALIVQGRVSSEVVGDLIWSNSTTMTAGSLGLTATNFLLSDIPLAYGQNPVHLVVSNSLGQTAGRSLVVFRQTSARQTFDAEDSWVGGLCNKYWDQEFTSLKYVPTNVDMDQVEFQGTDVAIKKSVTMDAHGSSWAMNPNVGGAMVRYQTSFTMTNFSVYLASYYTNVPFSLAVLISTNSGATYDVLLSTNENWFDGACQYKKYESPSLFAKPQTGAFTLVEIHKTGGGMIFVDDFDYSPVPTPDDMDVDGLLDAWELFYFSDLAFSDGSGDIDEDGLIDAEEYHFGTNPFLKDTDDDGQSDWEEFIAGTEGNNILDTFAIQEMSSANEWLDPLVLYWDTVTGRTYRLYMGMSLTGDWSIATQVLQIPGDGQQKNYTNENVDRIGFFRLTVEKP